MTRRFFGLGWAVLAAVAGAGCGGGPAAGAAVSVAAPAELPPGVPMLAPRVTFRLPGPAGGDLPLLSADGSVAAFTYQDAGARTSRCRVYDLTQTPPKLVRAFPGAAYGLSPSGKRLYTSEDNSVFEVASGKAVGHVPGVGQRTFFLGEDRLLTHGPSADTGTGGLKGRIILWDVAADKDGGSFDIPDGRFRDLFPAKDGREAWVYMNSGDREVRCYDLAAKALARTVKLANLDPGLGSDNSHANTLDGSRIFTSRSAVGLGFQVGTFHDGETGAIVGRLPAGLQASTTGFLVGTKYLAVAGGGRDLLALHGWECQPLG